MRRNRGAGVEDRWYKIVRDEHGNTQKVPSSEHARGLRWRARYVDDEGRERSKMFDRKADAQAWLNKITAKLATGSYVSPEAGRITVADVYAAWSAAQGHISAKTKTTRRNVWNSRVQTRWGALAVVDVKTSAVKSWVAAMVADGAGVPTIENAFGVLRQVMGAALEDNRIARNPVTV